MTKKLIIAEKPSVASDIARALGGMSRKPDYYEGDEYAVSSAVGHLLELVVPESHDVKKGKWTFKHLPVIQRQAPAGAAEADPPQRHLGDRQRLRCRARRRADFPLPRATLRHQEANRAAVAAVHDDGRDSGGIPAAAPRSRAAAARRRRQVPLGSRLAGRHQRHARNDRLQLQGRRVLSHHGGTRADTNARHPGRARGEDPRVRRARLLGGACPVRRESRRILRALVRSWVSQGRRRGAPCRAPLERCRCGGDCRRLSRREGAGQRGNAACYAGLTVAFRPDEPAA